MEINVIQGIHESFTFDLFEQVRQANDFSFLQSVCPVGLKFDVFVDQVERYRTYYPTNNFITESQIGDICRKYGLVLGSFLNFTGIIPIKNRLELKTFSLRPEDQVFEDPSIPGRIFNSLLGDWSGVDGVNISPNSLQIRSGFIPGDYERPFEIMPIGDSFILVAADTEHDVYRLFLKLPFWGSEWLIDLGLASISDGLIWVAWKEGVFSGYRSAGIIRQFEVSLNLPLSFLSNVKAVNLTQNVCPVVVAPGTMFERFKDAVEVSDYRLRFKPGLNPPDRSAFIHIDDPIILQPVPYGYLVVTKWGKEAYISEIQNPKTN